MKLLKHTLIVPLTSSCLLAALALAGCIVEVGGDDEGSESSDTTGDGDGDPGDGDGDPGDGDGDPGDGDGDPGDGDGDPGDGDGDPGDGDGDPGDGDGDPGDGDGDPGDGDGDPGDGDGDPGDGDGDPGDECAPFDAQGVGPCEAFFGYSWTGDNCIGISGCECSGTDCDQLYESSEACWDDHALCELTNPCVPDEAEGVGPCDQFFGWAWDGDACVGVSGCECQGVDCAGLPLELEACEAEHVECEDPPPDGCANSSELECASDPECMELSGSALVEVDDGWCTMDPQFVGCDELAGCAEVLTWGCGPDDAVALFPNACLPVGWSACEPPVFGPPMCG